MAADERPWDEPLLRLELVDADDGDGDAIGGRSPLRLVMLYDPEGRGATRVEPHSVGASDEDDATMAGADALDAARQEGYDSPQAETSGHDFQDVEATRERKRMVDHNVDEAGFVLALVRRHITRCKGDIDAARKVIEDETERLRVFEEQLPVLEQQLDAAMAAQRELLSSESYTRLEKADAEAEASAAEAAAAYDDDGGRGSPQSEMGATGPLVAFRAGPVIASAEDLASMARMSDLAHRARKALQKPPKSGYIGVSRQGQRWFGFQSQNNGNKQVRTELYDDKLSAALASDRLALEQKGRRAITNFHPRHYLTTSGQFRDVPDEAAIQQEDAAGASGPSMAELASMTDDDFRLRTLALRQGPPGVAGYYGVTPSGKDKWTAQQTVVGGPNLKKGGFSDKISAAVAYDWMALKHRGLAASMNFHFRYYLLPNGRLRNAPDEAAIRRNLRLSGTAEAEAYGDAAMDDAHEAETSSRKKEGEKVTMAYLANMSDEAFEQRKAAARKPGVTGYRGVTRYETGKFTAEVQCGNLPKNPRAGPFQCKVSAAVAWDWLALKHKGVRAVTNFHCRYYLFSDGRLRDAPDEVALRRDYKLPNKPKPPRKYTMADLTTMSNEAFTQHQAAKFCKQRSNRFGYRGLESSNAGKTFFAHFQPTNTKEGPFQCKISAAVAYDRLLLEHRGAEANTNFPYRYCLLPDGRFRDAPDEAAIRRDYGLPEMGEAEAPEHVAMDDAHDAEMREEAESSSDEEEVEVEELTMADLATMSDDAFEQQKATAKKPGVTGYRGVSQTGSGNFVARIYLSEKSGKRGAGKHFECKISAAVAYDRLALEHKGVEAITNFHYRYYLFRNGRLRDAPDEAAIRRDYGLPEMGEADASDDEDAAMDDAHESESSSDEEEEELTMADLAKMSDEDFQMRQSEVGGKKMVVGRSGYKGVQRNNKKNAWSAELYIDKTRRVNLGTFEDKVSAAQAYDRASLDHLGVHGYTNFHPRLYLTSEGKLKDTPTPPTPATTPRGSPVVVSSSQGNVGPSAKPGRIRDAPQEAALRRDHKLPEMKVTKALTMAELATMSDEAFAWRQFEECKRKPLGASGYRGVTKPPLSSGFVAKVFGVDGQEGPFKCKISAAAAFDRMNLMHRGADAYTNFHPRYYLTKEGRLRAAPDEAGIRQAIAKEDEEDNIPEAFGDVAASYLDLVRRVARDPTAECKHGKNTLRRLQKMKRRLDLEDVDRAVTSEAHSPAQPNQKRPRPEDGDAGTTDPTKRSRHPSDGTQGGGAVDAKLLAAARRVLGAAYREDGPPLAVSFDCVPIEPEKTVFPFEKKVSLKCDACGKTEAPTWHAMLGGETYCNACSPVCWRIAR